MAEIKVELEGVKELQEKLSKLSAAARGSIAKDAVEAGGYQIMNHARLNIHEVFSPKQSGGLSNSISVTAKTTGNGGEAEVVPHKVYARIQELGGTVRPVHASSLHFVIDGKDVFAKQVKIPTRPYLGPAAEDHVDEITKAMRNAISDGIRESV